MFIEAFIVHGPAANAAREENETISETASTRVENHSIPGEDNTPCHAALLALYGSPWVISIETLFNSITELIL